MVQITLAGHNNPQTCSWDSWPWRLLLVVRPRPYPTDGEGVATFIAHHAALDHFSAEPQLVQQVKRRFADQRGFAELLQELAAELTELYRETPDADQARQARGVIFQRYQEQIYPDRSWQTDLYSGFTRVELSNAYLLAHQTYLGDLPCFQTELTELGGDLQAFVSRHRQQPGRHPDVEGCEEPGARETGE